MRGGAAHVQRTIDRRTTTPGVRSRHFGRLSVHMKRPMYLLLGITLPSHSQLNR